MAHINIEIKAKYSNPDKIREILKSKSADFKGTDIQIDTYFKVNSGRLKLREGKIENHLIYYDREDKAGPKQSSVILFKSDPESSLKEILTKSLGVLIVIDKQREIYFIDNVKFHLDIVKDLGSFVEIEAIDREGTIGRGKLLEQCRLFSDLFNISQNDLVSVSYSDLLLQKSRTFQIRTSNKSDSDWRNQLLEKDWGSTRIITRGRVHDAGELPAFIAVQENKQVGLITYRIDGDKCEIVTLNSLVEGAGIGSALIDAVKNIALSNNCKRLWLITTNDNTPALHFYQKRGFQLAAVHCNALEQSRKLKHGIPLVGKDGIQLRDEIELEMLLQ